MKNIKHYILFLYLFLFSITPLFRTFGSIDVIGPQFLWLSIINSLFIIPYFFYIKKSKANIPIIILLLYIIVSLFSAFYSSNVPETFLELSRIFALFLSLFFTFNIFSFFIKSKVDKFLLIFIISITAIETFISLNYFFSYYNFGDTIVRSREFAGLSYNVNIGAFSILLKLPFLFYFLFKTKSYFNKSLLTILSFFSLFSVFLTGSRAAILTSIIFCFVFIIFFIFKREYKRLAFLFSFFLFSFLVNQILFSNNSYSSNVIERVTDLNNDSTKSRLRYYLISFEQTFTYPFIGTGLGTYKSESLKFEKDFTDGYSVAYNNHNDILQSGFELGVLGFLLHFALVLSFFYLLRYWIKDPLFVFLFCSALSFIIDSNLNFPIHRPIIMIQVIFLLSYLSIKKPINFKLKTPISIALAIFSFASVYALFKTFESLKVQNILTSSFNQRIYNPKYLDLIDNLDHTFPNISVTSLPIASLKAIFYLNNDQVDKAKNLALQAVDVNPLIGFNESVLSQVYLKENNLDSSLYYAKKAFYNYPNTTHSTILQSLCEKTRKFDELDSAFSVIEERHNILEWENYLAVYGSVKFDYDSIVYRRAEKALKLFPNSKIISRYANFILKDKSTLETVLNYDQKALLLFKEKKYESALKLWLSANQILPSEESYIDNIIKCYFALSRFQDSIELLKSLDVDFKKSNPKFFYYLGVAYLSLNKNDEACRYLYQGAKLDHADSKNFYNKICN